MKRTVAGWMLGTFFAGLVGMAGAQNRYSGPQVVMYLGDDWCYGGYCGGGTSATFGSALNQALLSSGYVQTTRQQEGASLNIRAGITGFSGGNSVCLPIVGCLSARTVTANLELSNTKSGAVIYRDTCQGTSAGYSSWWYWTGGVNFDSDDDKAAADCAAKLVQKLTASAALQPYLTTAPAPASNAATNSPTGTEQASLTIKMLEGALKSLAFADMNGLFTSDPYNPVKLKELNAAASSAALAAAAKVKLTVTPGEKAGAYQVVGVTYTLPDGKEKFVQLALSSDPSLNTRGGTKIVYLSAFNPLRAATPALDGVSKNVELLLNDLHAALGLPGL